MELIFLGTGAGMPAKQRNVSSIALTLYQENNHIWLFDCGEATQHQILNTTLKPGKINKIFISHMHGDHIFGLPGVLSSRSFQNGLDELTIYGPEGIESYVRHVLNLSHTHLSYPLSFVEVDEGKIMEDDQFTVYCQKLDHGVPSYGYRVVEKDKPGELLINKLKDAGIEPGPIYNTIKNNPVTHVDDNLTIYRKDVVGPPKKGRQLAIIGDTRCTNDYLEFVKDVDVLVHEATFASSESHLADRYHHTSTDQAARLAQEANVNHLILTHISARYLQDGSARLLHEAQAIFTNTSIAYDFFSVTIHSRRETTK